MQAQPLPVLLSLRLRRLPDQGSSTLQIVQRTNAYSRILYDGTIAVGQDSLWPKANGAPCALRLDWPQPLNLGDAAQPLRIGFVDAEADIQLDADHPIVLLRGSQITGILAVHSSAAVEAEALAAQALELEAPALRTYGLIEVEQARLVVGDIALQQPLRARQAIRLEHRGGLFQVGDNLQTPGLLEIQFQRPETLQQSFDVPGSLRLTLAPTVTEPWVLLHGQSAQHALELDSPVPLTVGAADHRVNLSAKTQVLLIKS